MNAVARLCMPEGGLSFGNWDRFSALALVGTNRTLGGPRLPLSRFTGSCSYGHIQAFHCFIYQHQRCPLYLRPVLVFHAHLRRSSLMISHTALDVSGSASQHSLPNLNLPFEVQTLTCCTTKPFIASSSTS